MSAPDHRRELDLICRAQDGDEDAFGELLLVPAVAGMVRALTAAYEARGLYDAESIIYELLCAKLHGRVGDAEEGLRSVKPFGPGQRVAGCRTEIVGALDDAMRTVGPAVAGTSRQWSRYQSVRRLLADDEANLEALLHKTKLSKADFMAIRDASSRVAALIEVDVDVPSLSGMEAAEAELILDLLDDVADDEQKQVVFFRWFHDERSELSDAQVAEELDRDAGERCWTRSMVRHRRQTAVQAVRDAIGLAVA